jgi:cellulose synthase/poly-beta-1,6-N-acetylglucosamine synthase-like glycosyltransferase
VAADRRTADSRHRPGTKETAACPWTSSFRPTTRSSIDRTLRAYRTGFPQADVCFLVALDGCDDHTSDVVRAHAVADGRVVLHEFPKLGKGGVLMETFRRSDAELVAFVDADCATPRPSWPA